MNILNNDSIQIGWNYYNNIKKKAMVEEFSSNKVGGLLINLSIAFFIVSASAYGLNLIYELFF